MKLNVRCCCNGSRVLGTLEVPDGSIEGRVLAVRMFEERPTTFMRDAQAEPSPAYYTVQLRYFYSGKYHGPLRELAVYSNDRPLDFWRKLIDFKEGERV